MTRIGSGLKTKYQNITAHSTHCSVAKESLDNMLNQHSLVWIYFNKSDENDE
jgi:hypothetical protein